MVKPKEETSPWISGLRQSQGTVDNRRLHQGLVTTTWHGLRFRTSGGGAYSPSSNLGVSSVQSCRGCRRFYYMPLTKSARMSSVKIIIQLCQFLFFLATFTFNSHYIQSSGPLQMSINGL